MAGEPAEPLLFAELQLAQPRDVIKETNLTVTSVPQVKELVGKTIRNAATGATVTKFCASLICYSATTDLHNCQLSVYGSEEFCTRAVYNPAEVLAKPGAFLYATRVEVRAVEPDQLR